MTNINKICERERAEQATSDYLRLLRALAPLARASEHDARAWHLYTQILTDYNGGEPDEGWHLGYNC